MPTPPAVADGTWQPRSQLQLLLDQIHGVQRWHDTRDPYGSGAAAITAMSESSSREQRVEARRVCQSRHRERAAVVSALDRQLRDSTLPGPGRRPRAVLAHRSLWFRDRLMDRLQQQAVDVMVAVHDGADALGAAVAEQPDLLFVEDRLPNLPGLDVLIAARLLAPGTLLAAQLLSPGSADRFTAAGAHVLHPRRAAPADVADHLARSLWNASHRSG